MGATYENALKRLERIGDSDSDTVRKIIAAADTVAADLKARVKEAGIPCLKIRGCLAPYEVTTESVWCSGPRDFLIGHPHYPTTRAAALMFAEHIADGLLVKFEQALEEYKQEVMGCTSYLPLHELDRDGARDLRDRLSAWLAARDPVEQGRIMKTHLAEAQREGAAAELKAVDEALDRAGVPSGQPHVRIAELVKSRDGLWGKYANLERTLSGLAKWEERTFKMRAADALADEVAVLVHRREVDPRSPVADALLDFRNPPSTERADRLAAVERERDTLLAAIREWGAAVVERNRDRIAAAEQGLLALAGKKL